MFATRTALRTSDVVVRAAIVALVLGTAYIHSTLGGLLFTLNALGYLVAAVAMIIPLGIAIHFRWFIRLGLIAYAATAIGAWYVMGPRYDVAYLAKAIEVVLIALLLVEVRAYDGNPLRRLRRSLRPAARA